MWSNCANIVNTATGMCLEAPWNDYSSGVDLRVWSCDGSDEQEWNFAWDGNIEHLDSGKNLDTHSDLSLWSDDGTSTQVWSYDNGFLRTGGQVLEMWAPSNGSDVVMMEQRAWNDSFRSDQIWSVVAC